MINQNDINSLAEALGELQSTLHELLDLGEQTTLQIAKDLIDQLTVRYVVKDRCSEHKDARIYKDPTVARSCLNVNRISANEEQAPECWELFPVLMYQDNANDHSPDYAQDKEVRPHVTQNKSDAGEPPPPPMWLKNCELGPLRPMPANRWECPRCKGSGQKLWTNGKGRQGCEVCAGQGVIFAGDSRLTTEQPKEMQL